MTSARTPTRPVRTSGADLVVVGGRVRDPHSPAEVAEALAVVGDRIAIIGTTDEVLALRDADTEVVDVGGGTVLPAFTDSHTHFKRASLVLTRFINFDEVMPASIDDVVAAVRQRAAQLNAGEWVQGDSLNHMRLRERRFPDRHELDTAAPSHPVVLRGVGRHVVAANSLALRAAGIDHETPDPPGGRIERGADGEPTGVLHEQAQLRLDANRADTVVPQVTEEERLRALSDAVGLLSRLGIAAIHEIPRDPAQIADWLRLREIEDPRVRIRFYIRGIGAQTRLEQIVGLGLRGGLGDDWVRLCGTKISIDGSCTLRNALVYEPYPGDPTNTGVLRVERDTLREAVATAHRSGLQIAVHAIGPRAVDLALDAFSALADAGEDLRSRRHRIEHAYLPAPDGQLERMRDLGLVLSTQPSLLEANGDAWVDIFADDELKGVMPLARALALGIPVQINSDFPCSRLEPMIGIQAAVLRRTRDGRTLDPSQAIDVATGFRLMTSAPAWTAFEEERRGRILPGQLADLMVLDADPFAVGGEHLHDLVVTHTIVGGRVVFRHESIA